ncbi:hypothetical protein JD844_026924 [Phrynosoma platyrhinos]|uniref:ATP-dependent RNA helicase DDX60 n=1 Tax=Phrynosoma platyrhinos TaxID=52577 RepID=A0ABQ7SFI4_PHRPL|nr:hypothetical protein JD844_026924 [Phrynosoma platyrhinos]
MASKPSRKQGKASSKSSKLQGKTKEVPVSVRKVRSEPDFKERDLQKCMEEITDLILQDEIPKAEYVSLLNDYVESEFFLIDGDSLFITCANERETTVKLYYETLIKNLKESSTKEWLSVDGCPNLEVLTAKVHKKLSQFDEGMEDLRYIVCIITCSLVLEIQSQHKLCEFYILQHLTTHTSWKMDFSTLPDLSDNLLWKNIAFYYEVEKGPDSASKITFPKPGLVPMENDIVKKFTGDILTDLPFLKSDDPVVISLKKQKDFDELRHWHSGKLLSDDYDRTHAGKNEKDLNIAAEVMRRIHSLIVSEGERKELKRKHTEYAVGMGSSRFQLQCMSHFLIREERKDPDPRVQHFIPDTWQRELLDIVDNNESAVIVAPTSSGKTYASYYCMEKILRDGSDSVIVYVAPTKILVTVPQCLEILLLSPRRQEWAKRIRYVIFDEVHCLQGEIGAEVWEHLLVMIRCPFLALSATISNPSHLAEWLESVKKYWQHTETVLAQNPGCFTPGNKGAKEKKSAREQNISYKVKLVVHGERYNDLEKYVCSLSHGNFTIHHYHPCAALAVDNLERYGFPLDLSLSPRETVMLYDIMVKARRDWPKANELDPEVFFKDKIVITKKEARCYETKVKEELQMWIKHVSITHPEWDFNTCTVIFGASIAVEAKEVLEFLKPHTTYSSEKDMRTYFPHFVEKLQQTNKLPALFFLFNIKRVEDLAEKVCAFLEEKQRSRQIHGSEKEEQLRIKYKKIEKSLSAQTLTDDAKITRKDEKYFVLEAELDNIRKHLEKISEIPPDCTYANWQNIDNAVVTATGTLALGINMPCKSVVFVQNSVYLDALNYRQMSGRAGRRGQDLLGNVYFYDIPLPKIQKLIKSNVPELRGQFPLNISLILRLMLLASKADDKKDAEAKGYVDREGNTTGFSGLVTHLHYYEPSNIVLVEFLVKGLFHKLCQPSKTKQQNTFSRDVMETLVLVLAHLFARRVCPASTVQLRRKFYQSKVFLEDLPEDFAAALHEYNCKIGDNFRQFLQIVSTLADMKQEYKLPLSEFDFSSRKQPDSQLASHLMSCDKGRTAVSPFVCLSGNTELDLLHPETVNSVILRTIGISAANIPVFHTKNYDKQGRLMPLNAYVLDFYKHGSLKAMEQDNAIHEGEAYNLLKDFGLALKAIRTSLHELCDNEDDNVVLAFEQLCEDYWSKLEKV